MNTVFFWSVFCNLMDIPFICAGLDLKQVPIAYISFEMTWKQGGKKDEREKFPESYAGYMTRYAQEEIEKEAE